MTRSDAPSKNCKTCGKLFYKKQATSQKEWDTQAKYCSRECYWIDKNRPPTKVCPTCGKLFKPEGYWSTKAKFCSRTCSAKAQEKPLPTCDVCGKTCKKHGRRFCSRECKVVWYRADKVYNYLGDEAREFPHDLVGMTFWQTRAQEIRERDKVCQHCGMTPKENGRALDVHHIKPYRFTQDNSPDNLIALCRSCHAKADFANGVSNRWKSDN